MGPKQISNNGAAAVRHAANSLVSSKRSTADRIRPTVPPFDHTCGLESTEMVERGWIDDQGNAADPTFKTMTQGAATGLWAATSPQLSGLGGLYLEDCAVAGPATADGTGIKDYAVDPHEDTPRVDKEVRDMEFAVPHQLPK